jgi:hypothetical protein
MLPRTTEPNSKIALDLDEHGPARQQRANSVAIEAFEANLFEPACLHDARDAGSVVAVALIDLHLEHRFRVPSINTDHRKPNCSQFCGEPD